MDPNETLRLIKATIAQFRVEPRHSAERHAHAEEAFEYFYALDSWLTNGGFPPEVWNPQVIAPPAGHR